MNRWTVHLTVLVLLLISVFGCSVKDSDPLTPQGNEIVSNLSGERQSSQTHLWGLYEITIDPETMTAEAEVMRNAMFTANVVEFLNGNPAGLAFAVNNVTQDVVFTDVDIDVFITHPFAGLPQYDGYDVRGVMIGNGSLYLSYNSKLLYPVLGINQYLTSAPGDVNEFGRPDGYTRWYNPNEFKISGMFGYTSGIYATPGYTGTAYINPYKYFCDGLTPTSFTWPTLLNNQGINGIFRSGQQNGRNYYIRFPNMIGIKYSYAVIANWEDTDVHPANTPEAVVAEIEVTDDLWYLDETYSGGEIIADIKLFDWGAQVNSVGVMEEYNIIIDSTVLSQPYVCTPEDMTPIDVQQNYCEYDLVIPADNVTQVGGNEFWVIVEYPDFSYGDTGVPNYTGNDPLCAFFRADLVVTDGVINEVPICDLAIDPVTPAFEDLSPVVITFDATGTYDPDPNDVLTYEWDFDGDGNFDEDPDDSYIGPENNPQHLYYSDFDGDVSLRISDGNTGDSECSVPVNIITHQSKNVPLRVGYIARDIAVDPTNGDLLIAYNDNSVWKYPRTGYYQTGSQFIDTTMGYWATSPYKLDINSDQYTMVGGLYFSYNSSFIYDPTGAQLSTSFWLTWQSTACDIVAMGDNGTYAKDLCFMHGYIQTGTKYNYLRRHPDPLYTSFANHGYSFTEIYYDGYDKIYFDYIVGGESDKDTDSVWFLEDADYYASRWNITSAPNALEYGNAYFGTGSQTDDDEGFYQPKDISRDDQNRLFVLDRLSTADPIVKVWTVDGDTTTSIGHFGDNTLIEGDPLRIDGSDFEGLITVLHGGGPDPYRISVFHPTEMPGY